MRHILLVSFILLLVGSGFAKKVDTKTVKQVGKAYYYERLHKVDQPVAFENIEVEEVFTFSKDKENGLIYILNMKPEGFVMISGDDIFRPVLAYSIGNKYKPNVENQNFDSWTQAYVDEFEYYKSKAVKSNPRFEGEWKKYTSNDLSQLELKSSKAEVISPILTCEWNQNYPYNMYCPEDEAGSGGRVYAGCVATAMSMIMYYYKYPLQGTGNYSYFHPMYGSIGADFSQTTYDWDAMQFNAESGSARTKSAIAKLMYHCGITVNMNYGPNGSGSNSYLVPDAIDTYFGYSKKSAYTEKNHSTSYEAWYSKVRQQLDKLQPVYYSGSSSSGGHAFVCDGYDDDDKFHFNFGWSGHNNGYFTLTGGEDPVGGYNSGQAMIKNFYPDTALYPYHIAPKRVLDAPTGSITDGSSPKDPYETNKRKVWLIKSSDDNAPFGEIHFYFRKFDLQEGNDVLTIYNGPTTASPIAGRYTGSTLPENMELYTTQALVVYESDNIESENLGFWLDYYTDELKFCSGQTILDAPQGIITDGSDNLNYANNSLCQFSINVENAESITLSFQDFEMNDEDDFVEVYQVNPNELLGRYSVGDTPGTVVSQSGEMFVVFKTNGEGSAGGFTATYTSSSSK